MATQTLPPTKWRNPPAQRKPAAFVDVAGGQGVTHTGQRFSFPAGSSLRALVDALPGYMELLYLCGPLPGGGEPPDARYSPFSIWVLDSCQPQELGHGAHRPDFLAKVPRATGHSPVAVRTVASWFGTNDATPEDAHAALALADEGIRHQPGWNLAALHATPTSSGFDLWRRSIPFQKATGRSAEYPPLDRELRDLLHRTSGQGRFEYLPARAGMLDGTPAVYNLDMRWGYAAAAWDELGCAPAIHDHVASYAGFHPARYRIQYRVPEGWAHIGLFMTPDPRPGPDGKRRWHYPRTPGFVGECWADGSELRVALGPFPHVCETCREAYRRNTGEGCPQHGWPVTIIERILFTKGAPLRAWAEKLAQLREQVATTAPSPQVAELARSAVRNILLHAIGAFHGMTHVRTVTQSSQNPPDVPDVVPFSLVAAEDGAEVMTWGEQRITGGQNLDYLRPEWSSQIWGHTRARLLLHRDHAGMYTGALTLPPEQIVALRLDSLLLTADPHWPDDGKGGRFRLKGIYAGPIPWPQSEEDLSNLAEIEAPHV